MPLNTALIAKFSESLDHVNLLAQSDFMAWWAGTEPLEFVDSVRFAKSPFAAIVETYGEQASYVAADYLFQQRSLDDVLSGLEFPEVAAPAKFDQALGSFQWAVESSKLPDGGLDEAVARRKLSGLLQRLVVQPARETVSNATTAAGTGYARIPEPGACAFCLMLASRGAVYRRETVLGAHGGGRKEPDKFHDRCRCIGIEVRKKSELPQINQDLEKQWANLVEKNKGKPPSFNSWERFVDAKRAAAREKNAAYVLPGVKPVEFEGKGTRFVGGAEQLLPTPISVLASTQHGGIIDRPSGWSVDQFQRAIRETLESPQSTVIERHRLFTAVGVVDGKTITIRWRRDFDQPVPLKLSFN